LLLCPNDFVVECVAIIRQPRRRTKQIKNQRVSKNSCTNDHTLNAHNSPFSKFPFPTPSITAPECDCLRDQSNMQPYGRFPAYTGRIAPQTTPRHPSRPGQAGNFFEDLSRFHFLLNFLSHSGQFEIFWRNIWDFPPMFPSAENGPNHHQITPSNPHAQRTCVDARALIRSRFGKSKFSARKATIWDKLETPGNDV